MSFRVASALLVVILIMWILPLGVFIKPSQEGQVCGGKRAVHMCMMSFQENAQSDTTALTFVSNPTSQVDPQPTSSGGGNEYLSLAQIFPDLNRPSFLAAAQTLCLYSAPTHRAEPVPKTSSFS